MKHNSSIIQALTADEIKAMEFLAEWEPPPRNILPEEERVDTYEDYTTDELNFDDDEVCIQ